MSYTTETVKFLKNLPRHTKDSPWPREYLKMYRQHLRDPTREFAEELHDHLKLKLRQDVRYGVSVPTNMGHGYKNHQVFAFYDPRAAKWSKSVQLFFYLDGATQRWYYGFSVWPTVSKRHLRNLSTALEENTAAMARYFRDALPKTMVEFGGAEGDTKSRTHGAFAKFLASAAGTKGDHLIACRGMTVYREYPLRDLLSHVDGLVEEVGKFFVWAWPLFEASRTGRWTAGS